MSNAIITNSLIGRLPYIVGPFQNENYLEEFRKPLGTNAVPINEIKGLQEKIKDISLEE